MVENSRVQGEYLKDGLAELMGSHPIIGDVRGLGLLIGMEFVADRETKERFPKSAELAKKVNAAFLRHSLILHTDGNVLTVGPPICITRDECDEIIAGIDASLGEVEAEMGVS